MIEHQSVMISESINGLNISSSSWYVDGTFGGGGHSREILAKGGYVLGFDWDEEVINAAKTEFAQQLDQGQLILEHQSFSHIPEVVAQLSQAGSITTPRGYLFDFGTNSQQLMSSERGFSFRNDGPLDMRMDTRLGVTAADILNLVSEKQLAKLFAEFGGESEAKAIARAIKAAATPPSTVKELVTIIESVKKRPSKLHPATKVFQALRIAVNSELNEISALLAQLPTAVAHPDWTRVVAISFHEGEDRLVKNNFRSWQEQQLGSVLTKKPIQPSKEELLTNPRARSAKVRVFELTKS